MRYLGRLLAPSLVTALLALGFSAALGAQAAAKSKSAAPVDAPVIHQGDTPAFHRNLPEGGEAVLPPTLNPNQFSDPRVRAAYEMAAKVRGVLYREPCYCHCDKEIGHHSLLDCFAGDHASICETCMMEGVYAYQQTKAGKTPGQIRAGIERGEWKSVNLNTLMTERVY